MDVEGGATIRAKEGECRRVVHVVVHVHAGRRRMALALPHHPLLVTEQHMLDAGPFEGSVQQDEVGAGAVEQGTELAQLATAHVDVEPGVRAQRRRAYDAPAAFAVDGIAGTPPDDLWTTERSTGRSNDARALHFTAGAWTVVPVEGLERSAALAPPGGETWIASSAFAGRLDGGTPSRFALDGWLPADRRLWVGETAVWLTTPTQARRHGRR